MSRRRQVVALGYYDGPTEGVLLWEGNDTALYFGLVAWDRFQDQRLFVTVDIDRASRDRLLDILRFADIRPMRHIWIPEWVFENSADAMEADGIVKGFQSRAATIGRFALGNDPESAKSLSADVAPHRVGISNVLSRGTPDAIAEWRRVLSSQ
jgi:hypothetical protein